MEKDGPIKAFDILVIGGSAGSLDVITNMLPALKTDLKFPVIIVLHRRSNTNSFLAELFASKTVLSVKEAEDKDELKAGKIYVAPADYHLLIEKNRTLSLDYSEKINYSRPCIDITFETAADAYNERTVCILLTGASADGTEGLKYVKKCGGLAVVQSPETATMSYMPEQAIAGVQVDHIIDAHEMGEFISSL